MTRVLPALAALAFCVPATAWAHFPFLHFTKDAGKPELHVYFSESAEPDNPALLSRLEGAECHIVTSGEAKPLSLQRGEKSLVAQVPGKPAAFVLVKDMGILTKREETFHLKYYSKTFTGPEAFSVETGKQLALNVTPSLSGEALTLQVTSMGKPVPGAEIVVQGGIENHEGVSDEEGKFTCRLADPELYSIRVKHVDNTPGEKNGQKYTGVRHYTTVTLQRP